MPALTRSRPCRIVGLLPVRNEAHRIADCLHALARHTDAIVVLDDCSDDGTPERVEALAAECRVAHLLRKTTWYRDEPGDRNALLAAGRAAGGTHFIVIDADEALTANWSDQDMLREMTLALRPGDSLAMAWIQLWRGTSAYRFDDSVWTWNYKAIIFADDGACSYDSKFIHTPRIPENLSGRTFTVPGYHVGLLHYQFANWYNMELKQAWYRCLEMLRDDEATAASINQKYRLPEDETGLRLAPAPAAWRADTLFGEEARAAVDHWRELQILDWFHKFGVETFQELDIWHIDWAAAARRLLGGSAPTLQDILEPPPTPEEAAMVQKVEETAGWFSPREILSLFRTALQTPHDGRILEIGSYRGRSTNALGHAAAGTRREIYCMDIWRDFEAQGLRQGDARSSELPPTDFAVFEDFLRGTEWFSQHVRVLRCATAQAENFLPAAFFDVVFVDGAHDYDNVCRDIRAALKVVKPGGIVCGHDYSLEGPPVIQAVDELVFASPRVREKGVVSDSMFWYARLDECLVRDPG